MKVELKWITPNAELEIVEIARVSSAREDKQAAPYKLIKYLLDNRHFSPFEMANMCLEIETSMAIGEQLLRHKSATGFQKLSGRYQDFTVMFDEDIYEPIELRLQGKTNRQVSGEVLNNPELEEKVRKHLNSSFCLYQELIEAGVAKEVARFVQPACLRTRMYINASIRTWIHLIEIRDDESHVQKEMLYIAREAKRIFIEHMPQVAKALEWVE